MNGDRVIKHRASPLVERRIAACVACNELCDPLRRSVRYIPGRGNVCTVCEKANRCPSS